MRWGRILKLTTFGVAVALLLLDLSLAWIYAEALTRPGCPPAPDLPALSPPIEEVNLAPKDGLSVRAWYYPSRNRAAVVALGGQTGALGDRLPEVDPLLQRGFGVLQIDTRACTRPPERVTLGYFEAQDAISGLEFLATRPEVDPARIGVMGFSMGGVAAIRAAAREARFAAVLAEGGYSNLGDDIIEPEHRLPAPTRVFLYTITGVFWLQTGVNPWQSSPVDELGAISPRPVFLIYGEKELQDAHALEQFAAAGDPKTLWVVPGGDHGRNHLVAPLAYAHEVTTFFERTLLPP